MRDGGKREEEGRGGKERRANRSEESGRGGKEKGGEEEEKGQIDRGNREGGGERGKMIGEIGR